MVVYREKSVFLNDNLDGLQSFESIAFWVIEIEVIIDFCKTSQN